MSDHWRLIWVSSGRLDVGRGMVLFKDPNGKVVETRRFIGEIEILTNQPDGSNVKVTVVPSS